MGFIRGLWRQRERGPHFMGELGIRRNRGFAVPRYQQAGKTEKQAGSSPVRQTEGRAAAVSDTLRQLTARVDQAESQVQQARRALQAGESALAEVQDGLGRMEGLAREAAGAGAPDREALQAQLESLLGEIDRMGADVLPEGDLLEMLSALDGGRDAGQAGLQDLPKWLLAGLSGSAPDREALLKALGVASDASGAELLAALSRLPLEDSPAAGYLATLYLGAVIAGGGDTSAADLAQAAEGLHQLLDAMAAGSSPDEALRALTNGQFASLEEFEAAFTGGTAPGLEIFLTGLLQAGEGQLPAPDLPLLLAGGGGENGLLLELMAALENAGGLLDSLGAAGGEAALPEGSPATGGIAAAGEAPQAESMDLGAVRAQGEGLTYDPAARTATVSGGGGVLLLGKGQQSDAPAVDAPALELAGPGVVTVRQAALPQVAVSAAQATLRAEGEAWLGQVRLGEGTALTLEGPGVFRVGTLRGGPGSILRLTGGAAVVEEQAGGTPVPVVVDGPASLLAARDTPVTDAQGRALSPFDVLWKALLPGWEAITAMAVNGKQGQQALLKGERLEAARLWLLKGDPSHGFPGHAILLQGRDRAGRLMTRYVYLRWSQQQGAFQQLPLCPNPFTVTGGQEGEDWRYEEEERALHILTGRVSALSGGTGTDVNQLPFSGRVALADGIGRVELALDGVVCQVRSGRAFSLGRGNRVTLLLQGGSRNIFESGPGCAGISLGDGTSLCIDRGRDAKGQPEGALTATGGSGSPGIGRDSGVGRGKQAPILIRGGAVTTNGGREGASPAASGKAPEPSRPKPAPSPVSPGALGLEPLDVSSREAARSAAESLAAARRRVTQLQGAYSTLYGRAEERSHGLRSVRQAMGVVRDSGEADALLGGMRQSLLDLPLSSLSQQDLDGLGELLW